jgi:aldehyde dehydrogenase (NAD+)
MERWQHYIGGKFVAPKSDFYLVERNPRTRGDSYTIARGSKADVDAAVKSAADAFPAWRARKPIERGRVLWAIAQKMRERKADLVKIESIETGKSASQTAADIEGSAQYFEFYASVINAHGGDTIDLGPNYHSYTRHEPFGVVGIILPWNGPINQAARAVAPALAAGNTVVSKPSEFTSVGLLELARWAVEECGLPPGVLNIVTGTGAEAGAALVEHPTVRKIAFTGSVRAGRLIGKTAAERIIPVTLELGGKSPNIVFADADLDQAVPGSIRAFIANAGQACSSGSRLLVQKDIHDRFVEALAAGVRKVKVGGEEPGAIGPMMTEAQFEKVQSYFGVARSEGARAVVGGTMPTEPALAAGWYVTPTVYANVNNEMRIAREEIFGPVVVIIPFDTEEEAIRIANDTEYGLVAGIWTRDLGRAHRVAGQLDAGQVFVNEHYAGGVETPFGGYKMSGIGREKGIEALAHYTQLKCVTMKLGA